MIRKEMLFTCLVFILFLVGCVHSVVVSEYPQESVRPEKNIVAREAVVIEKAPIEKTPIPTGMTSQQDVVQNPTTTPKMEIQKSACSREFSPQFNAEPYYSGSLFDAHFHMPPAWQEQDNGWRPPVLGKEVTLSQILCYFDKEKVIGANAFSMWDYENQEKSIQDLANMKKQLPAGIHLFLIPSELDAEGLDKIVTSHKGVFDGFGEIVFYDPERPGATPDDPISLEINKIAAKQGMVVMFHPDGNQLLKVEHALQSNPQVKFLLHGWESQDYISELMDKYQNVYYSVDSATLYAYDGMLIKGPQERFISKFKDSFQSQLDSKVNKWKPQIEKHPDRFMWGTDRAADWHYSEEISQLFEEFARAFVGRLSPEVQEKYAYKNAEDLFKG